MNDQTTMNDQQLADQVHALEKLASQLGATPREIVLGWPVHSPRQQQIKDAVLKKYPNEEGTIAELAERCQNT